jgi:hypothetical protein
LFPHVQPGGFYAIEDLHTSYWDKYRSGPETAVAFLQGLVDDLNLRGRSGFGQPRNDPHYATLIGTLNDFERNLERREVSRAGRLEGGETRNRTGRNPSDLPWRPRVSARVDSLVPTPSRAHFDGACKG